jgi:hypothetical protein
MGGARTLSQAVWNHRRQGYVSLRPPDWTNQETRYGRACTAKSICRIERDTNDRFCFHASPKGIDRRLRALDAEWDIERLLEANAATLAFADKAA